MKITIERGTRGRTERVEVEYRPRSETERPMALDVLLQAQASAVPDLAYRYGCRNAMCGVCTIDVNGKPKLACRTKLRDGDRLGAMASLPRLRDLVVRRDEVNRQLAGRLPPPRPALPGADASALHSLNRCIECYACLSGCPSHARNDAQGPYRYGNPYTFLRIQKIMVDPAATAADRAQALALAQQLGIEDYDARRTPGCGMGINLKKEVILPLLQASRTPRAPVSGDAVIRLTDAERFLSGR